MSSPTEQKCSPVADDDVVLTVLVFALVRDMPFVLAGDGTNNTLAPTTF
jgi:hypothetical protein